MTLTPARRMAIRATLRPARGFLDGLMDRRLGIDTRGYRTATSVLGRFADGRPYEPIDYAALRHFVVPLGPRPSDIALDVGCGMGRVTCWLARSPVGRSIGVELDPDLAARASQNACLLRGRGAEVDIRLGDGCRTDLSGVTIMFLFNPFGAESTAALLENLRASLQAEPRTVRICYVFPQHARVLDSCAWLTRTGARSWPLYTTATYWTTTG